MKKVLVVTGTRADYGIYFPILKAIKADSDLELHLLVTGMHLSPQYGYTIEHIRADGFRISATVDCLLQGATHANMARSVGLAILGMTQAVESINPDYVVVLGDRGEMLAAAIVASHMNIPVAHLHGGEVSGTIDESVRHAISKLAHIHFPATEASRERLIRLGEDPWRIQVVGAPRIETILNADLPILTEVKRRYRLDNIDSYLLFAYHPVTTETGDLEDLRGMVNVLANSGKDVVCIHPNADAGTEGITGVYREFADCRNLYWITSFEQMDYLTILKYTDVLIGNSSSGIIEAASFHVPVINIGSRQAGRERSDNIFDIGENADELAAALDYVLTDDCRKAMQKVENVYEKAGTSALIVRALKDISNPERWIQKSIAY
ncbi:UDP-N,N'-diacetylbacillosamine 2-epimerase (hydrolyzing) [compost metagenome]